MWRIAYGDEAKDSKLVIKMPSIIAQTDKSSYQPRLFHIVSTTVIPPLIFENAHVTSVKHTWIVVVDYLMQMFVIIAIWVTWLAVDSFTNSLIVHNLLHHRTLSIEDHSHEH